MQWNGITDIGEEVGSTLWDAIKLSLQTWWTNLTPEVKVSLIMGILCMGIALWFLKKIAGFVFKWVAISLLVGGLFYIVLWYTQTTTAVFPTWESLQWWYKLILISSIGVFIMVSVWVTHWAFKSTQYLRMKKNIPSSHFNNPKVCKNNGGTWIPDLKKCAF